MKRLQSKIRKDKYRIVYVDGYPQKVTECGKMKNDSGEWMHCILRHGHTGRHKYAYGTGYRGYSGRG